eukprot:gene21031-32404_t
MNWKNAKISEVAKEKIWKEHVKNESQYRNSKETFSINPYRLDKTKPVTENITRRPKRFLSKEKAILESVQSQLQRSLGMDGSQLLDEINNDVPVLNSSDEIEGTHADMRTAKMQANSLVITESLKALHKTPRDKYDSPQTESHEVGWISKPLVASEAKFRYPLKSCDITRFAGSL